MSVRTYDYIIIGAGFAGLSTAYFLNKQGAERILVLEKEAGPGQHASGQNASLVCQVSDDWLLTRLSVEGSRLMQDEYLAHLPHVSLKRCGSLFTAQGSELERFQDFFNNQSYALDLECLTKSQVVERYPFLNDSQFSEALYCPSDGVVDIRGLSEGLVAFLKEQGVTFCFESECRVERAAHQFVVTTCEQKFYAQFVVNAAGAWAGHVAQKTGAQDLEVLPYRRHILVTEALDWINPDWPFVWDVSQEIYFRSEGKRALLSPCDHDVYSPGNVATSSAAHALLESKLPQFFPRLADAKIERVWAGLRTFSSDGQFVLGWDSQVKNFLWVGCLDGHGVITSSAVGKRAATMLKGESLSKEEEEALSPSRFGTASLKMSGI